MLILKIFFQPKWFHNSVMDMASSVAVVALQHYLCIKDEIPPTFLGTS